MAKEKNSSTKTTTKAKQLEKMTVSEASGKQRNPPTKERMKMKNSEPKKGRNTDTTIWSTFLIKTMELLGSLEKRSLAKAVLLSVLIRELAKKSSRDLKRIASLLNTIHSSGTRLLNKCSI